MKKDQYILDSNYVLHQEVTDVALQNIEALRRDASKALKAFTKRERATARTIAAALPVGRFFEVWRTQLQHNRQALKANESNKTLLQTLQKYLLLQAKQAPHVARGLVSQQDAELVDQFITSLHIPDTKKGRKTERSITRLLHWSDAHLESFEQHYAAAAIYCFVADQHAVTIADPHASFVSRVHTARKIKADRSSARRAERKIIRSLDEDIKKLEHNTLLVQIRATHIEAVEFLAARAHYEKKLAALDPTEAAKVSVRTDLMLQESKHLKAAYHTLQPELTSDTVIMHDASFDELVRQLFSISTVQKNRLMLDIKRHRELSEEKEEILSSQAARQAVLDELL